jgi:hypothetical protein
MKTCSTCGGNFFVDDQFCRECGKKLTTKILPKCPKCKNNFFDHEKFCTKCGTQLIPDEIPVETPSTE